MGNRPVSLPVCRRYQGGPDGLDAVGSARERSDRHEHVAAVAVSTASASWGHQVDAATKQAYWPGACGAPGADVPRTVGVWAGVVAAGDAFGGGFGIEHKQQEEPFLECDRLLGGRVGPMPTPRLCRPVLLGRRRFPRWQTMFVLVRGVVLGIVAIWR